MPCPRKAKSSQVCRAGCGGPSIPTITHYLPLYFQRPGAATQDGWALHMAATPRWLLAQTSPRHLAASQVANAKAGATTGWLQGTTFAASQHGCMSTATTFAASQHGYMSIATSRAGQLFASAIISDKVG